MENLAVFNDLWENGDATGWLLLLFEQFTFRGLFVSFYCMVQSFYILYYFCLGIIVGEIHESPV